MRQTVLAIVLLLSTCLPALAQPLAAYVNLQNELLVWDRGMIHKVDFLPPTQMKIGRTAIPYLDNARNFKIYYGGSSKQVNIGFTNNFYVTDNLVAYMNQKSLNVFDKGVSKNLTGICDQYFIADSLVLYLDALKGEYRVYYNGAISTVESFVPDSVLSHLKVGDNVVAMDNFANQFRIFYHGMLIPQEEYPVYSFDAGRNTVAYVDADHRFKIFHSGLTKQVDDFPPMNYHAGANLVAYVSGDGYFRIFYNDSVYNMGFYNPVYQVGDNVVAFKDPSGIFKVFYKGEITELENYYPNSMTIQYNSLAYINASNTLRVFTEGEVYDVTNSDLTSWQLNYDVISYQIGQGIFKVFYKGTEY